MLSSEKGEDEPDPKPVVTLPDESIYKPSATDGKGRVRVSPTVVSVRDLVTLQFVYTAEGNGIAPGGGVVCMVSQFWGWTPPQSVEPRYRGYVTARCSDPEVKLDVYCDRNQGSIVVGIEERTLRAGRTITIVYGDTSDGQFPEARGVSDRYAEREERFYFKVDGDGDGFFTPLAEQAYFRVEAQDAFRFVLQGPAQGAAGQPIELRLSVVDSFDNRIESYVGKALLKTELGDAEIPADVAIGKEDRGSVGVHCVPGKSGVLEIAATDRDGVLRAATSNPILVHDKDDQQYKLYWADLHGHGNLSDGTGNPEDWYRYARDVARLDVAALTEHDHWGYTMIDQDPPAWSRILEASKTFNRPGEFVTLPGYEWTNWTYGHKHVLFAHEGDAVVFSSFDERTDEPRELWSALGDRDCLTFNHHPGGGPIPTFWKYHNPHFEPVVEITSVHGVSESMGHPKCIYRPVESGMAQSALARGYRLGFIGSGDTHDGHPGMKALGGGCTGLAGIYATELSREGILAALRARRVFATTGCRSMMRFHMGAIPMGSAAILNGAQEERTFSVSVLGDAPIASMTLIKNNEIAARKAGDGRLVAWQWSDPESAVNGDYYYVRIEQTDGEWIFSSPIWIELPSTP